MKIVIIYDNRRSEKEPLFKEQLERQGIKKYEIFPAIVLTHSVIESISASFKEVIRQAKENNEEEICIFEDDIFMPNENAWKYFLENKPAKYSVYIGGNYLIDNRLNYTAPLVQCNEWVGNHCILVHNSYFDTWLETDEKLHCDNAQANKGIFYSCFPFIALQRAGNFSLNHKEIVNYNNIIPKEYIY